MLHPLALSASNLIHTAPIAQAFHSSQLCKAICSMRFPPTGGRDGGKGGAISILISDSDWIIVKPNRADREIASNRFGDCREDTNGEEMRLNSSYLRA